MSKSQYFKITYENDFDEKELYDKIKILSMKNNRDTVPPRIYIYKNEKGMIALLDYAKKVTLSNFEKFNFASNGVKITGLLESVSTSTFNHIIAEIKPHLKYQIEEKSITETCRKCKQVKLTTKFMPDDTTLCIGCHKAQNVKEPNIDTSKRIMEELDPTYQFRTMYDNYIMHNIYSKKHNLTKDEYINKLENDILALNEKYTECVLMIHKLTKLFPSTEMPLAPIVHQIEPTKKHIYVLNLGCANRLINEYVAFKTVPTYLNTTEKYYILKYGITNDMNQIYNKYDKLLRFTYDSPNDRVSVLIEKSYKEVFADVCFLSLKQCVESKVIRYYRLFKLGKNKHTESLILVNETKLNMVKTCVEYL